MHGWLSSKLRIQALFAIFLLFFRHFVRYLDFIFDLIFSKNTTISIIKQTLKAFTGQLWVSWSIRLVSVAVSLNCFARVWTSLVSLRSGHSHCFIFDPQTTFPPPLPKPHPSSFCRSFRKLFPTSLQKRWLSEELHFSNFPVECFGLVSSF